LPVNQVDVTFLLSVKKMKPSRPMQWRSPKNDCLCPVKPKMLARMEDVLELYARPHRQREPVICLDERWPSAGSERRQTQP
jgi:hypothetical protein